MNSSSTSSSSSSSSACSSRPPARNASAASTPLLALALEHLQLLVLGQRPLQLLLGRAQAGEDQAQRVAALGVARAHRLLELVLDLGDQAHAGSPRESSPPRTCQCRWKTVWPPPGPTLTTHAVVLEAGVARGLGDELEHPLRLLRRELADVAERVDVPLGEDEQVRLGLRVDVADRDEAVRLRDVVALADERAEEAVVRQRRDPLLGDGARRATRTSSPTGASTSHGE